MQLDICRFAVRCIETTCINLGDKKTLTINLYQVWSQLGTDSKAFFYRLNDSNCNKPGKHLPQLKIYVCIFLIFTDPCVRLNCSKYFGSCVLSINSAAECKCLHDCRYQDNPVCGDDKNTYYSECALMKDTCIREIPNNVRHHGQCGKYLELRFPVWAV